MEMWRTATSGEVRVVLIEGERGVGKTRLADEFMQWATIDGATVLRGRGYDATSGIPYAPVAAALRGLLDAPGLVGADPEWLADVARLLLTEEDREYRCAHPVIADVVRENLTPARRQELHRAIALSLEASEAAAARYAFEEALAWLDLAASAAGGRLGIGGRGSVFARF